MFRRGRVSVKFNYFKDSFSLLFPAQHYSMLTILHRDHNHKYPLFPLSWAWLSLWAMPMALTRMGLTG